MKSEDLFLEYEAYAVFPKKLFTAKKYAELSSNAKVLYVFLFDRAKLSQKHGYTDLNGEIFVYCPITVACEILNCSKAVAIKNFNELENCGLIRRVRRNQADPYKIYPQRLDLI